MIPYGRHEITQEDIDAVVSVLRSDFITQGSMVPRFEQLVAQHVGAGHGVAVNSATSALHIACLALGLGRGDYLWTSPITFVASANCALYCGAKVDFVDIDPQTYNLCPEALAVKLKRAESEGRLPKVVMPVHMCGQPCDLQAIHRLAQRYGFKIIEDASHAIGGKYLGELVGNCQFSDITVFSFHPVKIITTGEGGMAMTNAPELASNMALLRSHGITRDPAKMSSKCAEPWRYEQVKLGFNYRMTDIQAALGMSQMQRLDSYVARRQFLAQRYDRLLEGLPLVRPLQNEGSLSSMHLYVVRLQLGSLKLSRFEVFEALRERGISVNVHYIPVHTQPFFQSMGFKVGDFEESEAYYNEAMTLPLYPAMLDEQQDAVVDALQGILKK